MVDRLAVRGGTVVHGVDRRELRRGDAAVASGISGATRQVLRLEIAPARIVEHTVLDPVVRVARGEDARPEQLERGRGEHRGVDVALGMDRLLVLHEACRDAGPVVGGRRGHDAVEVVRVALRLHHRLPAAPRAADEVGIVGRPLVVVRDDRLCGFGGQMHGAVAEVLLPSRMIECPARLDAAAGVPGVGPDRGVAALQRASAVRVERAGLVLHAPHEAAAAAHQETPVPVVGQQQLEVDLRLDGPGDLAVRRQAVLGGYRFRRPDVQVEQLLRPEARAGIHGVVGGRRRTRSGNRQARGNDDVHDLALDAGHHGLPFIRPIASTVSAYASGRLEVRSRCRPRSAAPQPAGPRPTSGRI